MSQTKAQLIQPIGVVTASTIQVSGVVTATTFIGDVTGTVTGLSTTTVNLDVGIVTTSAMVGDVTGSASSVYSGNNIVAGVVTATKFTGNTSGRSSGLADGTNANIGIITASSFIGNLTGNAASLSNTDSQLNLGIVTATSFAGNFTGIGSGLTGTPDITVGTIVGTALSVSGISTFSDGDVLIGGHTQGGNDSSKFPILSIIFFLIIILEVTPIKLSHIIDLTREENFPFL